MIFKQIYLALIGTSASGQSGPGSNDSEVLHTPQSTKTGTNLKTKCRLVSYLRRSFFGRESLSSPGDQF